MKRHELIHFKRKDLWIKLFVLIANSLHWFNPFVHILRREIHKWSELSCDEEMVKEMSYIDKKRYDLTILNMLESSNKRSDSFYVFLSGGKKDLERRLTMLLKVKKVSKPIIIIAFTVITATGISGTTAAAWASQNTPNVEVTNQKVTQSDLNDNKEEKVSNKSNIDEIISVKKTDEERFRPEDWKMILSKIKTGEIVWED
ncbi:M56 family metallopeptidase [Lysinibacillus agricola]|uniref:M56 family metallopeptidase n=1 Tax=Lysinibacillus agricola TaxID=2590012 RepID=UPI003C1A068E